MGKFASSSRRNGFTIIELIVVIAVIAILAAILIFSIGAWQRSVRSAQVKNELNAATQAMQGVRNFTNNYPSTIPGTYTPSTTEVTLSLPVTSTTEFCLDGVSALDDTISFYVYSKQIEKGPLEGTCDDRPNLTPPSAPIGVSISAATQTSMTLGWSSVTGANSYIAQCAADPAFIVSKKQIDVDSPGISAVFGDLEANTQRYCRVKAVNEVGLSAWSAQASGKTGTPPSAPVVASSTNNLASAIFTWPAVSGAVSYSLQYNIDDGPWVDGLTDENTLTYTVSGYHNRTVNVRVVANSAEDVSSDYGTSSVVTPLWATLTYENGWSDYGSPYDTGGYTITSTGVVVLKGLIKRTGSVVNGETIATLPTASYYPYLNTGGAERKYTFMAAITGNGPSASIKVTDLGKIIASTDVNATATSLSQIAYLPSSSFLFNSFTAVTPINGWTNKASDEPSLGYRIDSLGRVFIQGSLDPGTITSGTDIGVFPTPSPDISVSPKLIIGMRAGCNGYTGINIDVALSTRGNCLGSAFYPQTMYYPNAAGAAWTTMTLKNSWVVYNASSNATPQYTKAADGIVTLKGLIKSGSTSSGVTIATLPAGYRPAATLVFASICADAPCRIDIEASGDIVGRGVDSGWSSLSGINFVAEQ